MDNNERIRNKHDVNEVIARDLTWLQIKEKYPHQKVGLVNVRTGLNNSSIKMADVLCTDKDTGYDDMCMMWIRGEIDLRYTTLDEDAFYVEGGA